ncbi:hypothetical protein [Thermococcus siculi]|nr:hypothetical protein [Thermococcus siculi]
METTTLVSDCAEIPTGNEENGEHRETKGHERPLFDFDIVSLEGLV